ncbi:F-box/FBD/LRR-repeat protein At1g13570 [Capsicum annuum]|uniref:F-box/FBD/LRR-repeat protein At1g13570 n=1 Tax=Capsicum annuum TaxID=4072 RepID=UPI0007BF3F0D|nr:F-box/FBD/LRR-repeat protein At1g13570 [Capsicum annuum]
MSDNTIYKLPSYVFNCLTLTHLQLFNCIFKPPDSFLGFQNLVTLNLRQITFVPTSGCCVNNAPYLVNLNLEYCHGTECLNIVASRLKFLIVHEKRYLNLKCFMHYRNFSVLGLDLVELEEEVDNVKYDDERSTLEKLLLSVAATLEFLLMGLGYFELLTADTIPKGPPFTRLQELSLGIDFGNLSQTTCALQLIKSCPNLSKLQIWGCASRDSAEAVLKYLKRPITCLDLRLNELKYVGISSHECSKTELLFVKLLFACTPSLVRMCYEQQKPFDSSDERKLTRKLMCFSRAFPSIFRIRRLRTTTCVAYIMV